MKILLSLSLFLNIILIIGFLQYRQDSEIIMPYIEDDSKILAIIDDFTITENDFYHFLDSMNIEREDFGDADKDIFLQRLVFDRLLFLEAKEMDIENDIALKRVLRDGIIRAFSEIYLKHLEDKILHIEREELYDFYRENKDEFFREAEVNLQLIYVMDEPNINLFEKKELILEKIKDGETFETLAKEFSNDPSAPIGGRIGWVKYDEIDKTLADIAFNEMEIDHISEPIFINTGFVILKLTDRREEHIPEFESIKNLVRREMIASNADHYQRIYYQKLEELRLSLIDKYGVKFLK